MKLKPLQIADLFCGAGGTSTGAVEAAELLGYKPDLVAINHWDAAIATHTANHPRARHLLTAIDNVNPRDYYTAGELDLLWASPECMHHSVARGGRPINEQSRATAWCVIRWADAVQPSVILVENVPEFISWGGIGSNGRPLKGKKGKTFHAWVTALESLGYRVDWRVLCAADYGDPTTRRRLFIQAVRGRRKIIWPEPTHTRAPSADMFTLQKPWVAAREIIDWDLEGQSIYERKRPLSDKTMRRIMTGLTKFGLRPFIVPQTGDSARSVDRPSPTVTTTSRGVRLIEPFIIGAGGPEGSAKPQPLGKPLGTVLTDDRRALCEPFILSAGGPECPARPVSEPVGTVLTRDHRALVSPFLIQTDQTGSNGDCVKPITKPLGAVVTKQNVALCEPFIVKLRGGEESHFNNSSAKRLDEPVPSLTTGRQIGIAEPFLIPNHGEREGQKPRCHSVDAPMPAVTAGGHIAVAEPFLIQVAHGNGKEKKADNSRARSIADPLPAVCGNRGDMALCSPSLLPQQSGGALRSVDAPAPTVATDGAIGLVEPFLVKFYGAANGAQSIKEPLDTVTVKDRHALVRPIVVIRGQKYLLDIRFRMLQPHELAGAQGFPRDYKFTGTKTEQVKLIGNAVPRRLARAIVYAVLSQRSDCDQLLNEE